MSHGPPFIVFHAQGRALASALQCYLRSAEISAIQSFETGPPHSSSCLPSIFLLLISSKPWILFCLLFRLAHLFYSAKKHRFSWVEIQKSPSCSGSQEGMNGRLAGGGQDTLALPLSLSRIQIGLNFSGPQFSPLEMRQAGLTEYTCCWLASSGSWESEWDYVSQATGVPGRRTLSKIQGMILCHSQEEGGRGCLGLSPSLSLQWGFNHGGRCLPVRRARSQVWVLFEDMCEL